MNAEDASFRSAEARIAQRSIEQLEFPEALPRALRLIESACNAGENHVILGPEENLGYVVDALERRGFDVHQNVVRESDESHWTSLVEWPRTLPEKSWWR